VKLVRHNMRTCGGDIAVQQVFSRLSIHALVAKIWPHKVVRWCPDGTFWRFLHPAFSAIRVQHISDLHPKYALRPRHVWKKKEEEQSTEQKYNVHICYAKRP